MLLYDKKEKSLDVYDFNASQDSLANFRKNKIKPGPDDILDEIEIILIAKTRIFQRKYSSYGPKPLFEVYTKDDRILSANYADDCRDNGFSSCVEYHDLIKDSYNERLINCYINGHLANRNVVRIEYPYGIKYFLLKRKKYKCFYEHIPQSGDDPNSSYHVHFKDYIMKDIIQLPKSLYLLQLLEQERFKSLDKEDIAEQLALYTISKINEVSFEELQKMDACGITQDGYSKTIQKADNDAYILKKIRKNVN